MIHEKSKGEDTPTLNKEIDIWNMIEYGLNWFCMHMAQTIYTIKDSENSIRLCGEFALDQSLRGRVFNIYAPVLMMYCCENMFTDILRVRLDQVSHYDVSQSSWHYYFRCMINMLQLWKSFYISNKPVLVNIWPNKSVKTNLTCSFRSSFGD
jgi:hypothetical protein